MNKDNENITGLVTDILEVGLDTLIDNEVLKEIPVLGSLVKIASIKNSISDRILLKKLSLFLTQFEKQSEKQKENLLKKLADNTDKEEIGESLMLLIDKFDNLDKPILLANLFHRFLSGDINSDDFMRMGCAINAAFINDIKAFLKTTIGSQKIETMENLLASGLSQLDRNVPTMMGSSTIKLIPSETGKLFHKVLS